jgi:hypothetical protein
MSPIFTTLTANMTMTFPRQTPPQPVAVHPADPGVLWARRVLPQFVPLLNGEQHKNVLRAMVGTGGLPRRDRWEILLQTIELETGDRFPPGWSMETRRQMLRQEAELRRRGHARR